MAHSIAEIAAALGATALGATDILVDGVSEPATAGSRDLALAMTPTYGADLMVGSAQCAVIWPDADWESFGLRAAIVVPRARLAMAQLTQLLDQPLASNGIAPTAQIHPGAKIGARAQIGHFTVIGDGAIIGDDCWVGDHVSIAAGAQVGNMCVLHPGVRLQRSVRLGDRVVLQPNVVIGGDGFSFVTRDPSHVETARETLGEGEIVAPEDPTWHRIHSLGGVEISNDVEVGASSTIDAGTIRPTKVGQGTKIDNQVQVGHNVIIGQHCLLCAQAGVAGSTVVGDRVVIGGMAGVADNLTIGNDVVLGGASVVLSNVPAGRVMMGYPATKMKSHIESYKALRRLPRLLRNLGKS